LVVDNFNEHHPALMGRFVIVAPYLLSLYSANCKLMFISYAYHRGLNMTVYRPYSWM